MTDVTCRSVPTRLVPTRWPFGTLPGFVPEPDGAMSLTEAVAYIADETINTKPDCCCPVLSCFGQTWNDGLRNDTEREQLLPYVERLVGTRSDRDVEQRRGEQALGWLIREYTPAWLDLAGLTDHAAALRTQTHDTTTLAAAAAAARVAALTAREKAGAITLAVRAAARAAVSSAAGTAARNAYWVGATGVEWHARWTTNTQSWPHDDLTKSAFFEAAWAAAETAAMTASWVAEPDDDWAALRQDVLRDALEPTIQTLQTSAHELFDKMIAVGINR